MRGGLRQRAGHCAWGGVEAGPVPGAVTATMLPPGLPAADAPGRAGGRRVADSALEHPRDPALVDSPMDCFLVGALRRFRQPHIQAGPADLRALGHLAAPAVTTSSCASSIWPCVASMASTFATRRRCRGSVEKVAPTNAWTQAIASSIPT